MLKKIDRGRLFLASHSDLFACPLCHQKVVANESGLICPNRHRFDLSKKGTLFFLDHPVKTDYDQDMFVPRSRMIQSGMYGPVLEAISKHLEQSERILDIGCGEGSFLAQLLVGQEKTAIGFDIAKEGVYLATNHAISAFWCVADLTNLPFAEGSFDTILNLFSPSNYQEFERIIKPGGQVIKVVPAAGYLKELRKAFYPEDTAKQIYSNERVVEKFFENYPQGSRERISYSFAIPEARRLDLLAMSPLEWGASQEQIAKVRENPLHEITVDIELLVAKFS
jgi:23S rRNA (guanine745-N1)-methyltransferase